MFKKGYKQTEEHKRKIGDANKISLKGKHCSPRTEFKKGNKINKGKNNPNFGKYGMLNPNWIDGRSFEPYTSEFNEQLKESIRKRDNHTCQNCSMTEEEHLTVVGQVLHIHHIDYNKINCQKENLITLCQSCNSRANFNRDYWKKIYTEKINKMGNIKIK